MPMQVETSDDLNSQPDGIPLPTQDPQPNPILQLTNSQSNSSEIPHLIDSPGLPLDPQLHQTPPHPNSDTNTANGMHVQTEGQDHQPYQTPRSTNSHTNTDGTPVQIEGQDSQPHRTPHLTNLHSNTDGTPIQTEGQDRQAHPTPHLTDSHTNANGTPIQTEGQDCQSHQTPHITDSHTNANGIPVQTEDQDRQLHQTPHTTDSHTNANGIPMQTEGQDRRTPHPTNLHTNTNGTPMQTEGQDPQPHQTPHLNDSHTNTNGTPMQAEGQDPQTPHLTDSHTTPNGIPMQTEGQDPQPNQTPSAPLFNFQQGLLESGSYNFGTTNQPFQPQNLETMNFLLHNSGHRSANTREQRGDSSPPSQALGRHRRDSSPQDLHAKRLRTSSAPQTSHSEPSPMSTSILPHTLLQILDVRDQQARRDLLEDIRLLLTEKLHTFGPTGSGAHTEEIIEIVTPLLTQKSTLGKYFLSYVLFISH